MVTVARSTCWGVMVIYRVPRTSVRGAKEELLLPKLYPTINSPCPFCDLRIKPRMFSCGDSGQKYTLGCNGHTEVSSLKSGGLTGAALLTHDISYHLVSLTTRCEPSHKPRMYVCGDSGQKYMLGCDGHIGVSGPESGGEERARVHPSF